MYIAKGTYIVEEITLVFNNFSYVGNLSRIALQAHNWAMIFQISQTVAHHPHLNLSYFPIG